MTRRLCESWKTCKKEGAVEGKEGVAARVKGLEHEGEDQGQEWVVILLAEGWLSEHQRAGQIEGQSKDNGRLQARCRWRVLEARLKERGELNL